MHSVHVMRSETVDVSTAFVVLALVAVLGAIAWRWRVEHAVSALPGQARSEAFQDGLRDLMDKCLASNALEGPLRRHCLQQAHFVSQFPECNADCQVIARSVSSRAHH